MSSCICADCQHASVYMPGKVPTSGYCAAYQLWRWLALPRDCPRFIAGGVTIPHGNVPVRQPNETPAPNA